MYTLKYLAQKPVINRQCPDNPQNSTRTLQKVPITLTSFLISTTSLQKFFVKINNNALKYDTECKLMTLLQSGHIQDNHLHCNTERNKFYKLCLQSSWITTMAKIKTIYHLTKWYTFFQSKATKCGQDHSHSRACISRVSKQVHMLQGIFWVSLMHHGPRYNPSWAAVMHYWLNRDYCTNTSHTQQK